MDKNLKIIISFLITFIIGFFGFFIFQSVKYSYKVDWKGYKPYLGLFKESILSDLDTNYCFSYIQKRDIYNCYNFKQGWSVSIWEFKDLDFINLKNLTITQISNLDNVKLGFGETINVNARPEISIKYGFEFDSKIKINLDQSSKIDSNFETLNYKGFYGIINKMSFSNEKDEHQLLFDYSNESIPTMVLFYKGHNSFFVILIDSDKPFDPSIINILNLK